jgi:hypothetical protein
MTVVRSLVKSALVLALVALTIFAAPGSPASGEPPPTAERCNARAYTIGFWPNGHTTARGSGIDTSVPSAAITVSSRRPNPRQFIEWVSYGSYLTTLGGPVPKGLRCKGADLPTNIVASPTTRSATVEGTLVCTFSSAPVLTPGPPPAGVGALVALAVLDGRHVEAAVSLSASAGTISYEPKVCQLKRSSHS